MLVSDFLNLLLDDTLEAARYQRRSPGDWLDFLGTERALAECRVALTSERMSALMVELLRDARRDSAASAAAPDHAFWFSREITVEWVADVFSAVLMQKRLPVIVKPGKGAFEEAIRLMKA